MDIRPNKLNKGDSIGLCAPSNKVVDHKSEVENSIVRFEKLGFKVVLADHLFSENGVSSGTNKQRAEDINQLFRNPEIKAIFTMEGGYTCNGVLPYLDYEMIKNHPKIIMGLSDNTVLINAIYAKTGLITYHGNNAIYLFQKGFGYEYQEFEKIIMENDSSQFIEYEYINKKVIREGIAKGKLIGGNLRCFRNLSGTPYLPNCDDAILFLEAYRITDYEVEYMLEHLKQMGMFDKIKGIIVGYVYGLQHKTTAMMQFEDVLFKVSQDYNFPIIKCDNFGHCIENTILPIGEEVVIDTTKNSFSLNKLSFKNKS